MIRRMEYLYQWPDLAPASVRSMDAKYGATLNALNYAVQDVRADLERLKQYVNK